MAVTNYRKTGFATLGEATVSLINDLLAGGKMTLVFPAAAPVLGTDTDTASGQVKSTTTVNGVAVARWILESTAAIDVKSSTTVAGSGGVVSAASYTTSDASVLNNSWRICFDFPMVDSAPKFKEFLAVYVGTSVQLRNDGSVIALPSIPTTPGSTISYLEPAGNVGAAYRTEGIGTSAAALLPPSVSTSWDIGFYNRVGIDKTSGYAVPLSYDLTTSKRGIFFGMWDIYSEQTGAKFNWVLVQRSVDRASGAIRGRTKTTETSTVATFLDATATSVAPVWCVNSVNNKYWKFLVREQDIGGPSKRQSATDNTEDSTALINPFDQQSLTDDSKYVITFLSNLNTTRFKYPDELDMVGTVSSDVIGAGTEAMVTVYDETVNRVYRALPPNGPYGTGMRMVSLNRFVNATSPYGTNANGPQSETPGA